MIVLDASAVVGLLIEDAEARRRVAARMRNERGLAPELLDLEVLSALRRLRRAGLLDDRGSERVLRSLGELPVTRAPHRPFLPRIWELRHNLSAYDAAYVALAEATGVPLLTLDGALARASGIRCEVELAG